MMDNATYLVTEEIARRSGLIESRYRLADGRFVLNNMDLKRIKFSADEYINGLQGVTKTTLAEAQTLIAKNGYSIGPAKENEIVIDDKSDAQAEPIVTTTSTEDEAVVETEVVGEEPQNVEEEEVKKEEPAEERTTTTTKKRRTTKTSK